MNTNQSTNLLVAIRRSRLECVAVVSTLRADVGALVKQKLHYVLAAFN
jgi:hypothetical protein